MKITPDNLAPEVIAGLPDSIRVGATAGFARGCSASLPLKWTLRLLASWGTLSITARAPTRRFSCASPPISASRRRRTAIVCVRSFALMPESGSTKSSSRCSRGTRCNTAKGADVQTMRADAFSRRCRYSMTSATAKRLSIAEPTQLATSGRPSELSDHVLHEVDRSAAAGLRVRRRQRAGYSAYLLGAVTSVFDVQ